MRGRIQSLFVDSTIPQVSGNVDTARIHHKGVNKEGPYITYCLQLCGWQKISVEVTWLPGPWGILMQTWHPSMVPTHLENTEPASCANVWPMSSRSSAVGSLMALKGCYFFHSQVHHSPNCRLGNMKAPWNRSIWCVNHYTMIKMCISSDQLWMYFEVRRLFKASIDWRLSH